MIERGSIDAGDYLTFIDEGNTIQIPDPYPAGWKLLQIRAIRPPTFRQWLRLLWGFDLWLWRLPLLRAFVVLDAILVWVLRR